MSGMRVLLRMTWVEIKLLVREPVTLIFSFAFPVLVLVLLGGIFGKHGEQHAAYRHIATMNWFVPAYVGLVTASIGTISIPVHLSNYRERGVLRRFRASGIHESVLLGTQMLVGLSIALVGGIAIAIVGTVLYDGRTPASVPEVLLAFIVAVFTFAAIGALLSALAPTARAAQGIGLLLWFWMMFVSGTDGPLDLLPSWMLATGKALPLYHVVLTLADPWNGYGINWVQLGLVAGVGIVAGVMAALAFKWE